MNTQISIPLTLSKHLKNYPTPKNLGFLWNFGSLLGVALVIQILTGIFLAMYYTPHIELAFLSIEYIMRDVQAGWFLRYLHANTASYYFFFIYLHVFKALFYKSYNSYNKHLWLSGVTIFLLSMATAFLGYVLPWGQMSLWGATVITNLITAFPFIGKILLLWIWGGFSISNATLNRFFIVHVILPLIIAILVCIHILLLHEKGSSSLLGSFLITDKISFFPYYVYKDILGLFFFFTILNLFIGFNPNYLVGHPDNYIFANILITPLHIVPEWYFLPYYAILRSIPDKLGGVLAMGASLLIYLFISILDFSWLQSIFFRPSHHNFFSCFIFIFLLLKVIGCMAIEEPYSSLGQILAVSYFGYILFLWSGFSIIESEVYKVFYYFFFQFYYFYNLKYKNIDFYKNFGFNLSSTYLWWGKKKQTRVDVNSEFLKFSELPKMYLKTSFKNLRESNTSW